MARRGRLVKSPDYVPAESHSVSFSSLIFCRLVIIHVSSFTDHVSVVFLVRRKFFLATKLLIQCEAIIRGNRLP